MTYIVEIELPGSSNWFRYFTGIESREEAESIIQVAEGELEVRVGKKVPEG